MRISTNGRQRCARLGVEALEDRTVPTTMNASELFALQVANKLRENPATFANELKLLYQGGSYLSSHGIRANDPVWADLRAEINAAEAGSSWRSGFNSTGSNTFMSVAATIPARPPLAWDTDLQTGAEGHNAWMYSNFYTHSNFSANQPPQPGESPSAPIPGISRNFNVQFGDHFNWTGLGLNRAGENISYAYNVFTNLKNAYRAGQITLDAYYQRVAYADLVGYILEYNNTLSSAPWGHLENLTNALDDPNYYQSIVGIDNLVYENPIETEQGTPQSYFSTHRFGFRTGQTYVNLLAYQDLNNNDFYDAGEGIPATFGFQSNVVSSASHSGNIAADSTGYQRLTLNSPYTTYTVTASYGGSTFGSLSATRNGSNQTLTFKYVQQPLPTGVRNAQITFADDGSWWGIDGLTGRLKRLTQWAPSSLAGWKFIDTGDFNNDGRTDLIGYSGGDWWVGIQNGSGFTTTKWATWANVNWVDVKFGDFDNDGRTDLLARYREAGQWWGARSTGTTFVTSLWGTWSPTVTWVDVQMGDLDNDGDQDLVGRVAQSGEWWVAKANGTTLTSSYFGRWSTIPTWVDVKIGDINGDGRADIVARYREAGQWWVALSTGTSFTSQLWATWSTAVVWDDVQLARFNNDARLDLVGRVRSTGEWWVGTSTGTSFTSTSWGRWAAIPWSNVSAGDYNGDGLADLIGRAGAGWWTGDSSGTAFTNRSLANLGLSFLLGKHGRVHSDVFNA